MIRPPFMARVAAGVAVTAYEETLKLPSIAVALPMTTVSQILQTTMRLQQVMTSLAIKGDQLLEALGADPEETAEWAVFDEDEPSNTHRNGDTAANPGRFALYSMPPATESEQEDPTPRDTSAAESATSPAGAGSVPEIAEYLDYSALTLAQLRARLRTLSVDDLTALLEYENAHAARPPFVTMLSNRITTARSK